MRRLCTLVLIAAVMSIQTVNAAGAANAGHEIGDASHGDSSDGHRLIAALAVANQRVSDIAAAIQVKQENVNRTLVQIAAARDALADARRDATDTERALVDTQTAVDLAQQRFDRFAASSYVNGPAGALPLAQGPEEILMAASTQQTLISAFGRVKGDLARRRTDQANKVAAAKAAQQRADSAAAEAQRRQDAAVAALTEAQQSFKAQESEVQRLATERDAARARLDAAHPPTPTESASALPARDVSLGIQWDREAPEPSERAGQGQWDTTLPMVPSANVAGDPIAIINAVLKIVATSTQMTAEMGRNFLTKLGVLSPAAAPADPGFTNGRIPRLYGRQASELVIRRAMSQLGVPYSWGGGNASGPSRGIDQGAGTVGFDCSGLMLYAFAGVGIKLDHYSGSQYNAGRKIPSSQMRRGDLIFYGPNASQHEAMYLGDGMMLEAPYTGAVVRVAPVRTSGMTPYVTRLIEY